jgi:hypothetical protein
MMAQATVRAWAEARAEGRAVALGLLGVRPRGGLAAAFPGQAVELFEFLLGLRPTLRVPDEHAAQALAGVLRPLNFGCAARLGIGAGGRAAYDDHLRGLPPAMVARRLTTREYALLQGRRPGSRTRLSRAPQVLVLPSAGRPADVRAAITAHLKVIRQYGHSGLSLLLADDAPRTAARELDRICADARRSGVTITRFAEWDGDGSAGAKQRYRRTLLRRAATPQTRAVLRRLLRPGLVGTANCVFTACAGKDLVWLEQDAVPYALTRRGAPLLRAYGTFTDVMGETPRDCEHLAVDVLHILDRLASAAPLEARPYERHVPGYEDTGYEWLGAPRSVAHGAPAMVHFHTCGQPDFRARAGHRLLLDPQTPPEARRAILGGGLPMQRLFVRQPPTVSFDRWNSAFGTVVGFPAGRLPGPPLMWDTRVRLVDFAVGDLIQAYGLPGCVAGTALRHARGTVTDSGRGDLPAYLVNEELLWPLVHASRTAWSRVPPDRDYGRWLRHAADAMARAGRNSAVVPAALGYALWAELRADLRRASRSPHPDVRAYGTALAGQAGPILGDSWTDHHQRLEATARAELLRYATQLRAWSEVADHLGRDRTAMPA